MEHNRTLSIIKDRKAKRFFILGGFIVVSAALGFMFLSPQQSRATIPSGGKQIEVGQVSYRLYESSNGINPGSPLANTNTTATLPKVGADFRLRVGLQNKSAYFKKLAEYGSGYEHNCAIMSDDSVYCWAMVSMEFLVLIQPPHQRSQYPYIHKTFSMGKLSSKSPPVFIILV